MAEHTGTGRIVVGVDGSDPSIAALQRGAQIADALAMPLEAVTTWVYPDYFVPFAASEEPLEAGAARTLELAVEQAFGGHPPENLSQTVLQGPAAPVLIDRSKGAYMLVLGNRGNGGFARLLLGSVSSACATHAVCPVLIMRSPG